MKNEISNIIFYLYLYVKVILDNTIYSSQSIILHQVCYIFGLLQMKFRVMDSVQSLKNDLEDSKTLCVKFLRRIWFTFICYLYKEHNSKLTTEQWYQVNVDLSCFGVRKCHVSECHDISWRQILTYVFQRNILRKKNSRKNKQTKQSKHALKT